MLAAAEANQVTLMYAENWLYAPVVQRAAGLIEASGGTILQMRAEESHSGSHASYAKSWRLAGGGSVVRLAAHPIGACIYLKQREGLLRDGAPITVASVTAEMGDLSKIASFQKEEPKWLVTDWDDVENWSSIIMTFSDGARALIEASDVVLGGMEDRLQVFLSNARIDCDMTHSGLIKAFAPSDQIFANEYIMEKVSTKAGWSYPSVDEEWSLGYPQEIRDFVESVAHDRPPASSGYLGQQVTEVMYAAYLSAEEGCRVNVAGS